ncbi:hypothetical protein A2U01_0034021, partial [Trifolium medium]|nr:hypothetical protein [Trifolium medium]
TKESWFYIVRVKCGCLQEEETFLFGKLFGFLDRHFSVQAQEWRLVMSYVSNAPVAPL